MIGQQLKASSIEMGEMQFLLLRYTRP